jgi:hypothetical protein
MRDSPANSKIHLAVADANIPELLAMTPTVAGLNLPSVS